MTQRLNTPFDLQDARQAARLATSLQAGAEEELRERSKDLATAEKDYRVALAQERMRLHAQDGVAWTATDDIARGSEHVADLRYKRDVARGVFEAAQAALWRHTADRKDVGRFIDWSARRELAEGGGDVHEPAQPVTFGARRAA